MAAHTSLVEPTLPSRPERFWRRLAWRRPFVTFFLVMLGSNAAGSIFNFVYNTELIVKRLLNDDQRAAFTSWALPLYNLVAYPFGVAAMLWLLWPLIRSWKAVRRQEAIDPQYLEFTRRRLVNIPFFLLFVNLLCWLPGAAFFPAVIVGLGGPHNAVAIWAHFVVSFVVSAVFTIVQTFFFAEAYLIAVLYPAFLKGTRPADIPGVIRIPFLVRLILLWLAVAVMPLVSVAAVTCNFFDPDADHTRLTTIALVVACTGTVSGFVIFWMVGRDLQRWLNRHAAGTMAIRQQDFDVRIEEVRPDEWGRLTDNFNDMAAALKRAQYERETFGQFVSPEVRDEILQHFQGLEVDVREVTVLFADIRGFTKRSAAESPEQVRTLLNRFLTLAVNVIETKGGYVNKFLGDGVMALFGATRPMPNHAELAVASATELLTRLADFNRELEQQGKTPMAIGVGVHTGPALVGCFGATILTRDGKTSFRREYTAIGETVNYSQRLEQMTKELGGPVLISDKTRVGLNGSVPVECLGPRPLPGSNEVMVVYRVAAPVQWRRGEA